ncbi:hypothetical protein [Microbacterium sp. 2FI]|uniref:hypothetical protein n=1 Tax=Microbacterium sp. 2FI TaxID=2502193 RepID=UPI0010F902ED|nr:hypothetical protein [Microbacterium sp. 2FI]
MSLEKSAWRASDAVNYESAVDAVNTSTAMLFDLAAAGTLDLPTAVSEATTLRREFLRVDGFDREAVERYVARLEVCIAELESLRQ